jgi:release factor glutamine methyltransferase
VDDALCLDCVVGLASVERSSFARSQRGLAPVVVATGCECEMVEAIFRRTPAGGLARRCRGPRERNLFLHQSSMERGSSRGRSIHSICGMDRIRDRAECRNRAAQSGTAIFLLALEVFLSPFFALQSFRALCRSLASSISHVPFHECKLISFSLRRAGVVKCSVQLKQSLTSAIARLEAESVPSPRMNAELLLMFVLGCDRAYLHAHPERELNAEECERYEAALAERSRGVPAQYITGHQEFWGMDLIVTPAVLIPRPETEHVIETVLEITTSDFGLQTSALGVRLPASGTRSPVRPGSEGGMPETELRIADVGTGSGCIALALAKELPEAEIHAIDISSAALEVARANAARHEMGSRIHFHEADLLAGAENASLHFVVSNPPYVGESEVDAVQLEVRKFEPRNAVFAGPTGTEVIERLIPQVHAALKPGGWLVMEISGTIAEAVKRLLHNWKDIRIRPDLQSIPRVIQARR